jgi:hypothetical protein
MSKKKTNVAITTVKKGEIYETKHQELLEVANGRLKDEGDLGTSFEGRSITIDAAMAKAVKSKTTDRYYLDDLARKLSKPEYDEWVEAGQRESEASEAANEPVSATKLAGKNKTKSADKPKAKAPAKKASGKMSALDAAAKVLGEKGEPMTTKGMIETMATKGYWTGPGGQTPHATLYAAILREITTKGKDARFVKADPGLFKINPKSAS